MIISELFIENFKGFYGGFSLPLNPGVNVLVGDNESGKSTILEAIYMALTGTFQGRTLSSDINPYMFNCRCVAEYLSRHNSNSDISLLPKINIELYFMGDELPLFEGNGNRKRVTAQGISFSVEFNPEYEHTYKDMIGKEKLHSLPVEFYRVAWKSFARDTLSTRGVPLKAALIDSSSARLANGSDIYISRIIDAELDNAERASIAKEYRAMRDSFGDSPSIEEINKRIAKKAKITDRNLKIDVDLSPHRPWQTTLVVHIDDVPFHHIGKGEQCILKTNLALGHQKSTEANFVLLEEPESHLSHTKLNGLMKSIEENTKDKQVVISTHSSFVANKLGLDRITLLGKGCSCSFASLSRGTYEFFKKAPGFQTLRLLLCKKAVLVEGPTEELIFQRAYMDRNDGRLPIEDCIDVISVGLTFERFLEIARTVNHETAVITDNDGDHYNNIDKKYSEYRGIPCIKIFSDSRNVLRTLEYQFIDANSTNLDDLAKVILSTSKKESDRKQQLEKYMINNKTQWALAVFDSPSTVNYPQYILDAVEWCHG